MKRKVIQLAGKTFVVSLPLDWARKNKIRKGDELEIQVRAHQLSISTLGLQLEDASITLHILPKQVFGKRELADLYIRGYNQVKIHASRAHIEELKKEKLLGFEIVDEGVDYVEYQNVAEGNEFDVLLRRTFLIIKEMGLLPEKETMLSLEEATNKFTNYCKRILNKNGYTPSHKLLFMYVIVKDLEVIADYYKYLAKECTLKKGGKEYFEEIAKYFTQFYDFFYDFDFEKLSVLKKEYVVLHKKGVELLKKEPLVAHYGLSILLATYNLSGPYVTMQAKETYAI